MMAQTLIEQYIEINPKVMLGKPVIKDTRMTVELILEKLANGESIELILEEHPRLIKDHIYAALAFAVSSLKGELLILTAA